MIRNATTFALLAFVVTFATTAVSADNWPQFRGPAGDGQSTEKNLPTKWSASDIAWRVDLKGRGQSTAVVWEHRIFLTTAVTGNERLVMCLNRKDGSTIWERKISLKGDAEELHKMNSWATSSCVTDGERVIAFFGPAGIHCFDMDGKPQWSRQLGSFPGPWGNAASPVIIGDMVVQNCDANGPSTLVALNKKTGEPIWKTKRNDKPRGGWSTPVLIDTGKRKEIALNGEFGVKGYDPKTGKELWFCKAFNGRGTPSPAWTNGALVVINGKPGDIYAVTPGGSGDVTKTHMKWHTSRRGGRDLPSPIAVDQHVFSVSMSGVASMYHAIKGNTLWTDRISGAYSGSPIAANGLIYIQNEGGDVYVIQPGNAMKVVATNKLPVEGREIFRASLSASDGQLFARSDKALYCIGRPGAE